MRFVRGSPAAIAGFSMLYSAVAADLAEAAGIACSSSHVVDPTAARGS